MKSGLHIIKEDINMVSMDQDRFNLPTNRYSPYDKEKSPLNVTPIMMSENKVSHEA